MPRGDVWCRVKSSLPARLVDISPLGVQVEIPAPLEPLAEVGVSIPVIGGTVWLRARVQRCRAAGIGMTGSADRGMVYRAGLEFTSAGQSEVRAIRAAYGPADLEAVDGPSISDSGSTEVTIVVPDDRLRKLG